jgi:methylated-DNA-[protein]-cysteine S-methyltransferase
MSANNSNEPCHHVWPTAWGPVGGVWGPQGLQRLALPHYGAKDLRDLLAWEHPGSVPCEAPFERLIELSRTYFNGQPADFSEIDCKLPAESTFSGKVLRACRAIPYGRTRSYGSLAGQIGREDAARAVATALSKNPIPLVIPCHRVTYSDGRPGGFSSPGGVALKQRMLDTERS